MSSRYGYAHRVMRRSLAAQVNAGTAKCARCGRRIEPGEPWDLDHDDFDPTKYLGPSHRRCNRASSTHRVERERSRAKSRAWTAAPRRTSRDW